MMFKCYSPIEFKLEKWGNSKSNKKCHCFYYISVISEIGSQTAIL